MGLCKRRHDGPELFPFPGACSRNHATMSANMKILSFALLAVSALALAADVPSLSGKWQIHSSIGGAEFDQACTFTQKDSDLTGTCVSDQGKVEISGKIDAGKVTWLYKSEYNGTPITVQYEGSFGAEAGLKGSVSVAEFGVSGDFTAVPAK